MIDRELLTGSAAALPVVALDPAPSTAGIWWDTTRSVDERTDALVGAMTLDEKVAQLGALWLNETEADARRIAERGVSAVELDAVIPHGIGQLTRPAGAAPDAQAGKRLIADVQAWLDTGTRLGIPALVHEECLTGLMVSGASITPSPLNLGATFDPGTVGEVAHLVGTQLTAVGAHIGLAPVLDVAVDQRWGRVEECFGEDPWLVAECGAAYVRGIQSAGAIATAKHFVGHGASTGGHNCGPVATGAADLHERHLLPFEAAIGAGVGTIMAAYHDVDGIPVCADAHLLTEVLRDRLGFDGVVVSDYWAIDWLHEEHYVTAGRAASAATALRAGVDGEVPRLRCYRHLVDGVRSGAVRMADVDRAVTRVIRQKIAIGSLDRQPVVDGDGELDNEAARSTCRRVAARSITVVHNDGALPLAAGSRLLICGPNATTGRALCGNYSWANHVAYRFGDDDGVAIPTIADRFPARHDGPVTVMTGCAALHDDTDHASIAMAAAAAADADLVVVVVGDVVGHFNRGTVGEGSDRDSLELPGNQAELVAALCSSGTPTVVVHVGGRPFDLGPLATRCAAVVCAWLPGEAGADAIVDVLTGLVDATGRLPISVGHRAGAQPAPYSASKLARRGYVAIDPHAGCTWPFGHGLSYTTFAYDGATCWFDGDVLVAAVTVTNTGSRHGTEVVQCYVSDVIASRVRPDRELRGVAHVALDVGASAAVEFRVPIDLLGVARSDGSIVVEPGDFVVRVGASSAAAVDAGRATLRGACRPVARPRSTTTSVVVTPLVTTRGGSS